MTYKPLRSSSVFVCVAVKLFTRSDGMINYEATSLKYSYYTVYTVSEKDCTLFLFIFLGAQCVESGVSCTDCY